MIYAAENVHQRGTGAQPGRPGSPHAEASISEDEIVSAARERTVGRRGGAVTPAVGALLSLLARLSGGRAVVEVGTGAGVSGLWLLSGMREDGVLTTIDVEPGISGWRSWPSPRLASAPEEPAHRRAGPGGAHPTRRRVHDLVFIDATPTQQSHFVTEGVRLLRPGG